MTAELMQWYGVVGLWGGGLFLLLFAGNIWRDRRNWDTWLTVTAAFTLWPLMTVVMVLAVAGVVRQERKRRRIDRLVGPIWMRETGL